MYPINSNFQRKEEEEYFYPKKYQKYNYYLIENENFDEEKTKDIDNQTNNFKKRLAEKKKKWIMNTSDIGQSSNLQSKNLVIFNTKKHLNKSFDAIGQDDNIFNSDLSIEPITMYNAGENSLNVNEGINNNYKFKLIIMMFFKCII